MISDEVSVIMHAYSVIYGSVMILTPILCFVRGIVRFIGKKAGCAGKYTAFFNHPTKLILGFLLLPVCRCSYFLEKPVYIMGGDCHFAGG